MDLNKAQLIQNDVNILLSVLETKYNVRLNIEKGKFYDKKFVPNISFVDVENLDINVEHTLLSQKIGYEHNIVGKHINYLGAVCKVVDIKPRNRKYPIIIEDSEGKQHKIEPLDISVFI